MPASQVNPMNAGEVEETSSTPAFTIAAAANMWYRDPYDIRTATRRSSKHTEVSAEKKIYGEEITRDATGKIEANEMKHSRFLRSAGISFGLTALVQRLRPPECKFAASGVCSHGDPAPAPLHLRDCTVRETFVSP